MSDTGFSATGFGSPNEVLQGTAAPSVPMFRPPEARQADAPTGIEGIVDRLREEVRDTAAEVNMDDTLFYELLDQIVALDKGRGQAAPVATPSPPKGGDWRRQVPRDSLYKATMVSLLKMEEFATKDAVAVNNTAVDITDSVLEADE